MRSNRLWIGVICGVALALSVVAAVDAGTQTAGAGADDELADIREQLEIVQNRSSQAMKRSNQALNYLAPIRTAESDNADDGSGGVVTGSNGGWLVGKLARGQKQLWATLRPDATQFPGIPIDQSGPASGADSLMATRIADGEYLVDFKTDVSDCSWTATPFYPAGSLPTTPATAVTARVSSTVPNSRNKVRVGVYPKANYNVVVQVLC